MEGEKLQQMSIWSHIDALRNLLLRAAAVLGIFALGTFVVMPWLFDNVVLAPAQGDFFLYKWLGKISTESPLMPDLSPDHDFKLQIININLASQFFTHMSASLWAAVVLAFPILLYLVWQFVSPALYTRERKSFIKVFMFGNLMFYLGIVVGYALVFPITLRFLAEYQLSAQILNQISLDSYMDNFFLLILMMGILFELPLVAWMLGRVGILKREFFAKYRRHAIVVLLIVAAVVTPTGDPFTLMIVFLPIYLLWEVSAVLSPRRGGNQSKQQAIPTSEAL